MTSPKGWFVTGMVHDQVIPTSSGQAVTGTYVYFTTNLGVEASVFVQDSVYNTETVKSMVSQKAKLVDEVRQLVGTY